MKYQLIFKDPGYEDWTINLYTNENEIIFESDLKKLIKETSIDLCRQLAEAEENGEEVDWFATANPVAIMDMICEAHPGWHWEDGDEPIVVEDGEW